MKKLTKLLLPSISVMLVAIMALTGATFAWFQNGDTATVEQVSANVVKADGMLISWDGKTWKSDLSYDDPEYLTFDLASGAGTQSANTPVRPITKNDEGADLETPLKVFEYSPISTGIGAYDSTNGVLNFYSATVRQNLISNITDATGTARKGDSGDDAKLSGRGYVKYDLYVNLAEESVVGVSGISVNSTETISWAGRVGFIYHGQATNIRDAKASSLTANNNFFIYEPNATSHTAAGTTNQELIAGTANTTGKFAYNGIIDDTLPDGGIGLDGKYDATDDSTDNPTLYSTSFETVTTTDTATDIKFLMPKGNNKITVYIWVEGQDADCLNDLATSVMDVSINLTKTVPSTVKYELGEGLTLVEGTTLPEAQSVITGTEIDVAAAFTYDKVTNGTDSETYAWFIGEETTPTSDKYTVNGNVTFVLKKVQSQA